MDKLEIIPKWVCRATGCFIIFCTYMMATNSDPTLPNMVFVPLMLLLAGIFLVFSLWI